MSGFNDKDVDIVIRLRECADLDEMEGATESVVSLTREAADTIEHLRELLQQEWDAI